jgi:hypothetical protein
MTQRKFSIRSIGQMYGYDESNVRAWRDRGMPTDTEANVQE